MTPSPPKSNRPTSRAAGLVQVWAGLGVLLGTLFFGACLPPIDCGAGPNVRKELAQKFVNAQAWEALELYRMDMGSYPTTAEGLQALITRPAGDPQAAAWHGPYLSLPSMLVDPWQHPYHYRWPSSHGRVDSVTVKQADGTIMMKNLTSYDAWSDGPAEAEGVLEIIGNWKH